jgi:hypothetical protein
MSTISEEETLVEKGDADRRIDRGPGLKGIAC